MLFVVSNAAEELSAYNQRLQEFGNGDSDCKMCQTTLKIWLAFAQPCVEIKRTKQRYQNVTWYQEKGSWPKVKNVFKVTQRDVSIDTKNENAVFRSSHSSSAAEKIPYCPNTQHLLKKRHYNFFKYVNLWSLPSTLEQCTTINSLVIEDKPRTVSKSSQWWIPTGATSL